MPEARTHRPLAHERQDMALRNASEVDAACLRLAIRGDGEYAGRVNAALPQTHGVSS